MLNTNTYISNQENLLRKSNILTTYKFYKFGLNTVMYEYNDVWYMMYNVWYII